MWCHGTVAELLGEAGLCRCARMPDAAYVHHPVLRNRKSRRRLATGRFCGDFRRYRFPSFGLRGPLRFLRLILASSLCIQKFHSPRHGFDGQRGSAAENLGRLGGQKCVVLNSARSYRGFNPRASNCWLHSAGASRNRSTPMPRGKRPSTAARTRSFDVIDEQFPSEPRSLLALRVAPHYRGDRLRLTDARNAFGFGRAFRCGRRACVAHAALLCRLLARTGHGAMADLSPLLGEERKSNFGAVRSVDDPLQTSRPLMRLPLVG